MKNKITNLLDNFFDWINEKEIYIGNLEFCSWVVYSRTKRKRKLDLVPDCEHCVMGWDDMSYDGECNDCGCCFDYHFNVPKWKCALPWRIKKLIKKVKGWE